MNFERYERGARQQNYQFAYHAVPDYLFRSDHASLLALAHPNGFSYCEGIWSKLAVVFPNEQVVQPDGISAKAYRLNDSIYALMVSMPSPMFSLEASHLVFVFQPEVTYFTVGNGVDKGGPSTLRRVSPSSNANCAGILDRSDMGILKVICSVLQLEPNIRSADDDEFRNIAGSIPACQFPPEDLRFNNVWEVGIAYRLVSAVGIDTTDLPAATIFEIIAKLPPEAHALARSGWELVRSKPIVTCKELDDLFKNGLERLALQAAQHSDAAQKYNFWIWIALGAILIAMCAVGEIGRRAVPGPNPTQALVTVPTIIFACLGMACVIYAFASLRRRGSSPPG